MTAYCPEKLFSAFFRSATKVSLAWRPSSSIVRVEQSPFCLARPLGGGQGPARETSRARPKRAAPKKPQENPHDVPETTQEAPCTQEASQLSPPEKPSMTC